MSENINKTSNFLQAIEKYAKNESDKINKEIENYKDDKLEQAKVKAEKDASFYISKELEPGKAAITAKYAKIEQNSKKELFLKRNKMIDEIRLSVVSKINDFRNSDKYDDFLLKNTKEANEIINGKACVITIGSIDESKKNLLLSSIENSSIEFDLSNTLGGFKVYCKELSIIIDQTFETKLNDEMNNFINKGNLKVVY